MKKVLFATATAFFILAASSCSLLTTDDSKVVGSMRAAGVQEGILRSGVQLKDTDGNTLYGNGGCMLQVVKHGRTSDDKVDPDNIISVGEYVYWYGEYRYSSGNALGVSCYRSKNMIDWEFRGNILPQSVSPELNTDGYFLERPKVIYNEKTGKYVLWAHREGTGWNYGYASILVAYGDAPDEEFTYVKTFRPFDDPIFDIHDNGYTGDYSDDSRPYGFMSRDCTLFVDDDGSAYFCSSASENTILNIYRLTDDYLDIDTSWGLVQDALHYNQKEAPCLIKRNGTYYMITSDTDGWNVTPSRYFYATNITGPWYYGGVFSDNNDGGSNSSTDRYSDKSQPAYIFKLTGTDKNHKNSWLYIGDRWGPAHGGSSTYNNESVLIKVEFQDADYTKCNAFFSESICPNVTTGEINYPQYFYIKNANNQYMTNLTYTYQGTNASWTETAPSGDSSSTLYRDQYLYQYRLVPTSWGYMIVNRYSGLAIASNGTGENGTCSMQTREEDDEKQSFILETYDSSYYKIKNYATQQYVSTWLKTTKNNTQSTLNGSNILWMTSYGYYPGWVGSEQTYDNNYLSTKIRQRWQLIPVNTADDEWDFEQEERDEKNDKEKSY